MADNRIGIEVEVEGFKKFIESFIEINKQIINAGKYLGEAIGDFDKFSESARKAGVDVNSLNLQELSVSLKAIQGNLGTTNQVFENTTEVFEKVTKSGKGAKDAVKDIAQASQGTDDLNSFAKNIADFAVSYGQLAKEVSATGNIGQDLSNVFAAFASADSKKIAALGNNADKIKPFFAALKDLSISKSQATNLGLLGTALTKLSEVRIANFTKLTKLGAPFKDFIDAIAGISSGRITNLTNFAKALTEFSNAEFSARLGTQLKALASGLTKLGKVNSGDVTSTLNLLLKFVDVSKQLAKPIASGLQGVNVPAKDFIEILEAVVKSINKFTRALKNLQDLGLKSIQNKFVTLGESIQKIINIVSNLNLSNVDDQFLKAATALAAFGDALRSISRSTILQNFGNNIDAIVVGLNKLIDQVNVGKFIQQYSQFTDQLKDLADALRLLAKFGKQSFNQLATAQAQQAKQATILLRQELAAQREREAAAKKQRKVNREYFVKSLQESNSALLKFIGNLRDNEDKATFSVRLQVFGLKKAVEFGEFLIRTPFVVAGKGIEFLAKQVLNLGIALTKVSFNLFVSGLKATLSLLKPVTTGLANFTRFIVSSSIALVRFPFKVVIAGFKGIISAIVAVIKFFGNLLISVIRLTYNIAAFAGKVIVVGAALKILLAPVRLLTVLFNGLATAVQKTFGIFNSSNTNKASKEFNDLNTATGKTVSGQNELQIELSETDRELQKSIRNTERANVAFAGLGTTANGLRIAQAFITGNAILKLIKQIATLTLAFKGLQLASQLANRALITIRFAVQGVIGSAFEAAAAYEALELSLVSLQAREAFLAGEFESVQAALAATNTTLDSSTQKFLEANGVTETYGDGLTLMEQRAQGLIKQLRILAIQSPLSLEDVAAANRLAQAYGFTTTESLRLTKAVVNFTAATGQSGDVAEGIIRALGQIRANGKLAKEELNQLAERGFGAVQALADAAGVSTQEFLEALSGGGKSTRTEFDEDGAVIDRSTQEGANTKAAAVLTQSKEGGIEAEAAIEALVQTLERDFAGAAFAATNTLGGMRATIGDLRQEILRLTFTPLFESLKPLIQQFLTLDQLEVIYEKAAQAGEKLRDVTREIVLRLIAAGGVAKGLFDAIPDGVKQSVKDFARFLAIATATTFAMVGVKVAIGTVLISLGLLLNPISLAVAAFFTFRNAVKSSLENSESLLSRFVGAIGQFVRAISDTIGGIVEIFEPSLRAIGERITTFASNMYSWGAETVLQFAEGMIAGIQAITSAISSITQTIAYWFKPQSPPRVAPDIDTWGEETGAEWLEGFTKADFQNIGDFTGTVRDLSDALELPEGTIDFNDLANDFAQYTAALKSGVDETEALDGLLREVQKETGDYSENFARIAKEYATLAIEEQKLIDLQKEYTGAIRDTNKEIRAIEGEQQYQDQERQLNNLQRVLNNVFATEEEKERARLDTAKIYAERKKSEIEAQQEEVDAQKDNIDLLKQRIGLDKEFSDDTGALSGLGGGAGVADKALKGIQDKALKLSETLGGLDLGGLDDLGENLNNSVENLPQSFGDFVTAFEEGKSKLQARIDELRGRFDSLIQPLIESRKKVVALGLAITAFLVGPTIIKGLVALAGALGSIVAALGPVLAISAGGVAGILAVATVFTIFGGEINAETLDSIASSIKNLGGAITGFIQGLQSGLQGEEGESFLNLTDAIASIGNIDAATFAQNLGASLAKIKGEIQKVIQENVITPFKEVFEQDAALFDETGQSSGIALNILNGILASLATVVTQLGPKVLPFLVQITTDIAQGIITQFQNNKGNLLLLANAIVNFLQSAITTAIQFIKDTGQNLLQTELAQVFIETFNNLKAENEAKSFGERIIESIKAAFEGFSLLRLIFPEEVAAATAAALRDVNAEISRIQIVLDGLSNTPFGENLIARFERFGDALREKLPANVLNTINFFIERFRENLASSELGAKLQNLAEQFINLGNSLTIIGGAILAVIGYLLGGLLAELPVILGGVIDTVAGIAGSISGLIDIVVAIFTGGNVREAAGRFLENFALIQTGLGDIFEGLINTVTNWIVGISILLGFDVIEPMLNTFRTLADVIGNILANIALIFVGWQVKGTAVFVRFSNIVGKIINGIVKTFQFFRNGASYLVAAGEVITGILGNMSRAFAVAPIGLIRFRNSLANSEFATEKFEAIKTVLENVKEAISTLFEPFNFFKEDFNALTFLDPFLPIKLAIQGVQEILALFGVDISGTATLLSETIFANPFETIYNAITDTQALVEPFKTAFSGLQDFFSGLELPDPLKGITESFNKLVGREEAKEASESVVGAVVEGIDETDIEVNPKLDTTKAVADAKAGGKDIGTGFTEGIDEVITEDSVQEPGNRLVRGWKSFWGIQSPSTLARDEFGQPIAEGIIEGIDIGLSASEEGYTSIAQTLVNNLQTAVKTALSGGETGDTSTNLVSSLFTVDEESVTGLTTQFSNLFTAILELLEGFIESFLEMFEEFIEELMDLISETADEVLEIISDTFATVIELLVSFIAAFIQLLIQMLARVEAIMSRLRDIFVEAARSAIDGFIEELEKLEDQINAVFDDIIKNLSEGDGNLLSKMEEFGKAVGNALVAGLLDALTSENNLTNVYNAGKDLGEEANKGLEDGSGVESPSKIWRQIGNFLVEGLVQGITKNADSVIDAARDLARNTNEVLRSQLEQVNANAAFDTSFNSDGILAMQQASGTTIINNNNYTMNLTVSERTATQVERNFAKMQTLRA